MTKSDSEQCRLHVLGTPDLRTPDGRRVSSVLSQPKRLGLLTYLALSPAPVSRDTIVADFWPESDEARARNALSQAVFHLRRSLHADVVQSAEGDRLWAPPEHLWCDAQEILFGDDPSAEVVEAAGEDLLAGWIPDESQPLQEWLDTQRRRVRERAMRLAPAPRPSFPSPTGEGRGTPRAQRGRTVPSWRERRRWPWIAALVVAGGVAAAIGMSPTVPSGGGPAAPGDLVVLLPRVAAGSDAPALNAEAIQEEMLARLQRNEGPRIVAAPYSSSLGDFQEQLTAIGTPERDMPDWILDVSIRAASDEARIVGLLFRSPTFEVLGGGSFNVSYGNSDAVLLDVPQEIAARVVAMVEEVLGRQE